jgi:hypothetical protein
MLPVDTSNNFQGSCLSKNDSGTADPAKQWQAIADKTRNVSELKDEEISALEEVVASLSQDGPST